MSPCLAGLLVWIALGAVTIQVQLEGADVQGHSVTASSATSSVEGVTDAAGRATLAVPPDRHMVLRVDGREAGEVRTPGDGFHASVAIRWPPLFTVRLKGDSTGAASAFRVVPIAESREIAPAAAREVALEAGALRVDWLLPGQRFDLYARAPDSGEDAWLWYAGPFRVEANAEETVSLRPAQHVVLRDLDVGAGPSADREDPETGRVLDVLASQLQVQLASHPDAVLEVGGRGGDSPRAQAVRRSLVRRGIDPSRIADASDDSRTERSDSVEIRIQERSAPPAAPESP